MRQYFAIAAFGLLTACARLDHVQIGEIDQSQGTLIPFNVQVSQFGFEAAAAAELANKVMDYIYAECPTGKMTGLTSVREAKAFGAVSGEIVRLSGYCIL